MQVSGSIRFGSDSSMSANLSMQATRQSVGDIAAGFGNLIGNKDGEVKTSSNGSLSYRNGRLFGVRRLLFTTDLRMNSQALLPMLGGPLDTEMAAWDTRLEYSVGLLTMRVNTLIARTAAPDWRLLMTDPEQAKREAKVNKSIMFSILRSFGG
jgi:hypothetical protein